MSLDKVYKIGSQLNKDGDLEITLLIDNEQCILVLDDEFIMKSCEDIMEFRCKNYGIQYNPESIEEIK